MAASAFILLMTQSVELGARTSSSAANHPALVPFGTFRFRHRQRRLHAVGIADIEQHPFRNLAHHFLWLEIDDEQRLLAFDLARIFALLFHSRQNAAAMIAEINCQLKQLVRTGDILDRNDRADANIDSIQISEMKSSA